MYWMNIEHSFTTTGSYVIVSADGSSGQDMEPSQGCWEQKGLKLPLPPPHHHTHLQFYPWFILVAL